jgi:hypothetical protein
MTVKTFTAAAKPQARRSAEGFLPQAAALYGHTGVPPTFPRLHLISLKSCALQKC